MMERYNQAVQRNIQSVGPGSEDIPLSSVRSSIYDDYQVKFSTPDIAMQALNQQWQHIYGVYAHTQSKNDTLGQLSFSTSLKDSWNHLSESLKTLTQGASQSSLQHESVFRLSECVNNLRAATGQIQTVRTNIDQLLSQAVHEINQDIQSYQDLGTHLQTQDSESFEYADIYSRREAVLKKINGYLSAQNLDHHQSNSPLYITQGSQVMPLLASLSMTQTNSFSAHVPKGESIMMDGQALDADQLGSGFFSSLLEMRDNILPEFQKRVDALAFTLSTTCNQDLAWTSDLQNTRSLSLDEGWSPDDLNLKGTLTFAMCKNNRVMATETVNLATGEQTIVTANAQGEYTKTSVNGNGPITTMENLVQVLQNGTNLPDGYTKDFQFSWDQGKLTVNCLDPDAQWTWGSTQDDQAVAVVEGQEVSFPLLFKETQFLSQGKSFAAIHEALTDEDKIELKKDWSTSLQTNTRLQEKRTVRLDPSIAQVTDFQNNKNQYLLNTQIPMEQFSRNLENTYHPEMESLVQDIQNAQSTERQRYEDTKQSMQSLNDKYKMDSQETPEDLENQLAKMALWQQHNERLLEMFWGMRSDFMDTLRRAG